MDYTDTDTEPESPSPRQGTGNSGNTDDNFKESEDFGGGRYNEETRELFRKIRGSMVKSRDDFVFACGGSVPIACQQDVSSEQAPEQDPKELPAQQHQALSASSPLSFSSSKPVTLRWDSPDASTPGSRCKLTFPIEALAPDNLPRLVADMAPATFGLGGKDVFDESYRKALKLDPSHFPINFSPYECGIIDAVAQILLPDWQEDKKSRGCQGRVVQAQRVCLRIHLAKRLWLTGRQIYNGPSGRFSAHVDTPRSAYQFCSLVVCLPVAHDGGQLEPSIQWAAFYSDCEHEVLEVKSGYRITLIYNLYAVRGSGQLTSHCKTLDFAQVPLYAHMRTILDQERFMPQGGYLGFYTSHSYPHTSEVFCIPDTLKGLDMAIWECFQALGCGVYLCPIAENPWGKGRKRRLRGMDHRFIGTTFKAFVRDDTCESINDIDEMLRQWENRALWDEDGYSRVAWLNRPGHEEFQLAFTAYGNESTADAIYSTCAIIVRVPPYKEGVGRKVSNSDHMTFR
ncbi:hypothetical protein AAE478_007393 [Parahypoxylon ruwenzoriense]